MGDATFRTAFPEGQSASNFGSHMAIIGGLLVALNSVPFSVFMLYIPHVIIFLFDSRSDVQSVLGFKHMNIYDRQNDFSAWFTSTRLQVLAFLVFLFIIARCKTGAGSGIEQQARPLESPPFAAQAGRGERDSAHSYFLSEQVQKSGS